MHQQQVKQKKNLHQQEGQMIINSSQQLQSKGQDNQSGQHFHIQMLKKGINLPEIIKHIDFFDKKIDNIDCLCDYEYDNLLTYSVIRCNHLQIVPILLSERIQKIEIYSNNAIKLYTYTPKKLMKIIKNPLYQFENFHTLHLASIQDFKSSLICFPLGSIKNLMLSKNKIKQIWRQVYQISNLINLDLSNNVIRSVQRFTSKFVLKINLSNNLISQVYSFLIRGYETLKQLDLSNNKIIHVPILKLPKLQKLNFQKNEIQRMDLQKCSLKCLQILNLNDNRLEGIVKMTNLPQLKSLFLNKNCIRQLNIEEVPILQILQLNSINRMECWDKFSIKYVRNLKRAQFYQYNVVIESCFLQRQLQSLRQLSITAKIQKSPHRSLPKLNCPNLQKLTLNACGIQNLKQFSKGVYESLKQLTLLSNKLGKFPLINAPLLEKLQINNNSIQDISQFSQGIYLNLKTLIVNNNRLTKIPLIDAPNVQMMNFSNNIIQDIKELQKGCFKKLRIFIIRVNKLTQVPLLNSPMLQKFILSFNKIKQIRRFSEVRHPHLKQLYLDYNQLQTVVNFQAPELQIFQLFSNTKITDISQFLQSSDKQKLKKISLNYCSLKFLSNQKNTIQQFSIKINNKNKNERSQIDIKNLDIKSQFLFKYLCQQVCLKQINFQNIKFDNFQFISFLSLTNIQRIKVQVRTYKQIQSSLAKLNINKLKKLRQISIKNIQINYKLNYLNFKIIRYKSLTNLYLVVQDIKKANRIFLNYNKIKLCIQNPHHEHKQVYYNFYDSIQAYRFENIRKQMRKYNFQKQ